MWFEYYNLLHISNLLANIANKYNKPIPCILDGGWGLATYPGHFGQKSFFFIHCPYIPGEEHVHWASKSLLPSVVESSKHHFVQVLINTVKPTIVIIVIVKEFRERTSWKQKSSLEIRKLSIFKLPLCWLAVVGQLCQKCSDDYTFGLGGDSMHSWSSLAQFSQLRELQASQRLCSVDNVALRIRRWPANIMSCKKK